MSITMIGLDTAKSFFQVHAVDAAGQVEIRRKLRRSELIAFFEKQAACTVVMEACGAAHHWARVLTGLGHDVKLIAPEAVRPFVKKGKKNDAADAAAICEAASRPEVSFVPIKSLEQQGVLALHSARSLLVKQQTMLANAVRGLAAEFGLTVPLGMGKLTELMQLVDADKTVPEAARQAVRGLLDQGRWLAESIETFEAEIVAHARRDDIARRLATIPGIGPITASLIAATVADIGVFQSARHFAAWLGLVPRQHSTGGKTRLGRITKTGNREIRRLLVLGATSMVRRAAGWNSAVGAWTRGVLERRPVRLVTVALANKMARIAWAVITRKEVYHAKGRVAVAAEALA
ncbi:MAG: IS110 family transposase [Pseudomonadota bacterium]|nr:IS110 family transposase [Pseudomonadota bacterium]